VLLTGSQTDSTLPQSAIILKVMFSPRKPSFMSRRLAATAHPLRVGAAVRVRARGVTGLIVGSSYSLDRVRVRWDGTGKVTHCLRASLEPAR
jgi:hypothetical protein